MTSLSDTKRRQITDRLVSVFSDLISYSNTNDSVLAGRVSRLESHVNDLNILEGPPGPRGPEGPAGPKGDVGTQGVEGKTGRDGTDGRDGRTGKVGAPGPAGKRGPSGPQGEAGRDGKDGSDAKVDYERIVTEASSEVISAIGDAVERITDKNLGDLGSSEAKVAAITTKSARAKIRGIHNNNPHGDNQLYVAGDHMGVIEFTLEGKQAGGSGKLVLFADEPTSSKGDIIELYKVTSQNLPLHVSTAGRSGRGQNLPKWKTHDGKSTDLNTNTAAKCGKIIGSIEVYKRQQNQAFVFEIPTEVIQSMLDEPGPNAFIIRAKNNQYVRFDSFRYSPSKTLPLLEYTTT